MWPARSSSRDESNRAGPYQGTTPNTGNFPNVGQTTFVVGDPQVDATAASANASFQFSDHVSAYATALASNRDITSFAFYRSRTNSGQGALLAQTYPDGFVPQINQYSKDRSLVAGVKGDTESGWTWDVSYNHGTNKIDFHTRNSINYSLGVDSPALVLRRRAGIHPGHRQRGHHQAAGLGLAYPVTLSFGGEYRREKWEQSAGEPNSYFGSGSQGFGGFTPLNAVDADRDNYAVYAGLEADLTDKFSAGVTGRYEDYSDFGDKFSGKLSARYAFTDKVALRATASSGFRAPSLAQQSYQAVTSTIVNGVFVERGTFPTTSAARAGTRCQPAEGGKLHLLQRGPGAAADRPPVPDRGCVPDRHRRPHHPVHQHHHQRGDQRAAVRAGSAGRHRVSYFTNGVDTRTRGVDAVSSYTIPFSASSLELTAAYSYNDTEVKKFIASPAVFGSLGLTQSLIGRDEVGRIEDSYPRNKTILSGTWRSDRWDLSLAATRYGSFTVRNSATALRDQTYDASWVLDASVAYKPSENWTLTLGADNLLDEYPDRTVDLQNSTWGMLPYSNYSPYGFNGAYVYGRVTYKW
jgi:iron complex outermembrane receptor protein